MNSLKHTRIALNYSQSEMAKYLQVSKSMISMVESGRRELSPKAKERFIYLLHELEGLDRKGQKLTTTPVAEAEIESLQIRQREIAQQGLSQYAITCENTIHSLQEQLETSERHYNTAIAALKSVAEKRNRQIPPDKVEKALLNRKEAEANIKLQRFPLHAQIILKAKLAAAEIAQQYIQKELSKLM